MPFSIAIKSPLATMPFTLASVLILSSAAATINAAESESTAATYVLIDSKGQTASATTAKCAVGVDSGLMWELKTDDGGIHDKNNTYRWGGIGVDRTQAEQPGKIFFDDWDSLVNTTNREKLCGFDDWRVPTIEELKTILDNSGQQATIDKAVFLHTLTSPYWTVSSYQNYPEHAQTVDFATGTSNYYNGFRGDHLPVRLVRSNNPKQ